MTEGTALKLSTYQNLILRLFPVIFFDTRTYGSCEDPKENRKILIKNFLYFFTLFNTTLFYIFTIKKLLQDLSDSKMLIVTLNTIGSSSVALLRVLNMFWHKREIAKILQLFNKTYYESTEEKYKFGSYVNAFKLTVRFYFMATILTNSFLYVTPIVTLLTTGERTLPLIGPFDAEVGKSVFYPFAMIWSIWSFGTMTVTLLVSELTLQGAIVSLAIEFEILKEMLKDMKSESERRQIKIMRSFVDKHNELSEHVAKLEKIYSFPLFAFIMSSSFFICCCAFTATFLDAADSVSMIYYCLSSLFQVYILCYFGQMLQTSGENLNREIYNCGWEEIENREVRRGLILIIKRSQKPKVLTVMKFADITMQHFASASN